MKQRRIPAAMSEPRAWILEFAAARAALAMRCVGFGRLEDLVVASTRVQVRLHSTRLVMRNQPCKRWTEAVCCCCALLYSRFLACCAELGLASSTGLHLLIYHKVPPRHSYCPQVRQLPIPSKLHLVYRKQSRLRRLLIKSRRAIDAQVRYS